MTAELDGMAITTLQELDSCPIEEPMLLCDVAEMWFHLGDEQRAGELYTAALELDDQLADAHYGLGMILGLTGDQDGAIAQWKRVRQLDATAPHAEVHVSVETLQRIADEALSELPEQALELLRNVPILIEDLPSEELVAEGADPRMLGLFDGHSLLEQESLGGQSPSVTTIHIYQRNIERGAEDEDDLAEEIRITVLHETAHFFGLDDDALDDIGLG
jgi:predicted Zn-dependent protease with MMP-like domain